MRAGSRAGARWRHETAVAIRFFLPATSPVGKPVEHGTRVDKLFVIASYLSDNAPAALDLQDGHITARVADRHRSIEFIGLLSDLDAHYPPEFTIRVILDNHSAHISKKRKRFCHCIPIVFNTS